MNVLCGKLAEPSKTYLCKTVILESSIDSSKVCQIVDDVVKLYSIERNNFHLLISDAAPYMIKAGKQLKIFYPKLFHTTCLSHLVHNCCLRIKSYFSKVDNLIATVKAATVKNQIRREMFREIGFPPDPVVTRWGSWLEAAIYYSENLPAVKRIVNGFSDSGILVEKVKAAVADENLISDLLVISRTYSKLLDMIFKFESSEFSIKDAYESLKNIRFENDPVGLKQYIESRLDKSDCKLIMEMQNENISPTEYDLLQSCQPTSAAVERSFSIAKNLLRINRQFKIENIEDYLLLNFNN